MGQQHEGHPGQRHLQNAAVVTLLAWLVVSVVGCGLARTTAEVPSSSLILTAPVDATRATTPASTTAHMPTASSSAADTLSAVPADGPFAGDRAFSHVVAQMALGDRYPGSPGHLETRAYIREQLESNGWEVILQPFEYQGFGAQNIIARVNVGVGPVIILGAHYDTRRVVLQPPGSKEPTPGAVDGASGVAVLLELAQVLKNAEVPREIWLAFFDVEDQGNGGIPGWEWIVGSSHMAHNLSVTPEAVVVVDMVGDADQQLFYEGNSDPELQAEIWDVAAGLGYESFFIPTLRHTVLDDHLPFRRRGIRAIDIVDLDYPYWHTEEDTIDKVSAESLERVGLTLQIWMEEHLE